MFVHELYDSNKISDSSIITIGNYDGFHKGHKFIISKMRELANDNNLKTVLLTFNPHTKTIISNSNFKVLTTFSMKKKLAEELFIDYLCEVKFNKIVKNLNFKEFINIVIKKYNPSIILFGYDNKIGKNKEGTFNLLKKFLKNTNIQVKMCDSYFDKDKNKVTTTSIKNNIMNYEIKSANNFLGREFSLKGEIIRGLSKGKSIGFPTANVKIESFEQLIPPNGVYSVTLEVEDDKYKAVCNVGFCPTIKNSSQISIEVHVINEDINLYGKRIVLKFKDFLRLETKFKSEVDLAKQIKKDILQVI
tara:strand:- start:30276 stop:31187 length:912 start_codon:yes stop_codon:yes gene_type:complete